MALAHAVKKNHVILSLKSLVCGKTNPSLM